MKVHGNRKGNVYSQPLHDFQARALKMRDQAKVAKALVKVLANLFGHDRVMLYMFNENRQQESSEFNNLDASYANEPRFKTESHIKNHPPDGPILTALRERSIVYIEEIGSNTYYVLGENSELVEKSGQIMDTGVVQGYIAQHGGSNVRKAGILFCPLIFGDKLIGVLRSDNILSGKPIRPEEIDIGTFLRHISEAANTSSASMRVSDLIQQQRELVHGHANQAREIRMAVAGRYHDILGDLGGLIGYISALEQFSLKLGSLDLPGVLGIKRMIRLISQKAQKMIDSYRAEMIRVAGGGTLTYKPRIATVDITDLVLDIIGEYSDNPDFTVELAQPHHTIEIETSERNLGTVLKELVRNASKFRDRSKPGRATVEISKNDVSLEITITDNGIGFSPEDAVIIFDERVHNVQELDLLANKIESHGLGLSEQRYIIEEVLKGTLRAESNGIGTGATFRITIPIA